MAQTAGRDIISHLSGITDPRDERAKRHNLIDILVIAICGVICGAETWVDIEEFGQSKEAWLRRFLELPNGIPSHDTFGRVFAQIKPEEFRQCFISWVQALREITQGEIIAIDGKTLRRSFDKRSGKGAIHLVSAWAHENRLVLGQVKTDAHSNEITAIPQLLQMLDLSGCIVTLDAMGCQKEIAQIIQEACADYVLALKANHGLLHEEVKLYLDEAIAHHFKDTPHDSYQTLEKDHGRIEHRRYWTTSDIQWLQDKQQWSGLCSIGVVEAQRTIEGHSTIQRRYYLSSLPAQARIFAKAVRAHWSIENSMHWVLDIAFRQDETRIRKDHGPENFAMLHHISLNLLKQNKTSKRSIKGKRLKAGWNHGFLADVLFKN